MKQFINFLPILIFLFFFKKYDIYAASQALIAATAVACVLLLVIYKKIEKSTIVGFVLVLIFGSLTVLLHNPIYMKWKVTVLYFVFAAALLFGQFVLKKTLIQRMLDKDIQVPDIIWGRLNIAWAIFFLGCGLLNLYVAFGFSLDTWVNFKVFGLTVLTLIFAVSSVFYLHKHMLTTEKE